MKRRKGEEEKRRKEEEEAHIFHGKINHYLNIAVSRTMSL
jgi:hypothetical protein